MAMKFARYDDTTKIDLELQIFEVRLCIINKDLKAAMEIVGEDALVSLSYAATATEDEIIINIYNEVRDFFKKVNWRIIEKVKNKLETSIFVIENGHVKNLYEIFCSVE